VLADAYERRGRLDSAAVWFGAMLDVTRVGNHDAGSGDWFGFGLTHSAAHWRLARVYAAQGDTARTREHAAAFLRAMRNPDPELAGMVEEARRYAGTTPDAPVSSSVPVAVKKP